MSETKARRISRIPRTDTRRPAARTATQASPLQRLQRALGNQAMGRLLSSGALQARLTVNQPGDRFEQQADRFADRVMRMPDPALQRTCQCSQPHEEEHVQAKFAGDATAVSA